VATWSKVWVGGRLLAGIVGLNYECCVLSHTVSVSGPSLVQRNPIECGVSECDHEF